jgi:hypothetical protein
MVSTELLVGLVLLTVAVAGLVAALMAAPPSDE